jgi:hypothetical protein
MCQPVVYQTSASRAVVQTLEALTDPRNLQESKDLLGHLFRAKLFGVLQYSDDAVREV